MTITGSLLRPAVALTGRGRLTILVYHRVLPAADALFPNAADARRFDEHLSQLAPLLRFLPLSDAVDMLDQHRLPAGAACVTFDDGYADNHDVALPILRRHRVPASFFVATGFLNGGRMWNDTIIETVRRAPGDLLALESIGLGTHDVGTPIARRAAIDALIGRLKYLPPHERDERVGALVRAVGAPLPDDLMMRDDQVRALRSAGMGIGAHTVTHPILAQIDDDAARDDVRRGREALQSLTGDRIDFFAYPNGRPGVDYGPAHVDIVRALGFRAALSTRHGTAHARSDRFQLPRFTPWGRSAFRFAAELARNNLRRH